MSKKQHDEASASHRKEDYEKAWYQQGFKVLKSLSIRNFNMLDLGCGNGEFSEIAREQFNAKVFCTDYSENHLGVVRDKGFEAIKCDFDHQEDVERLNNTFTNQFDVIVSFEVIEHIFDVDAFLATAHNLLKTNGCLIISTPNYSYITYRLYSILRGNIPVSEGHHIRFFNQRRLKQTLVLNGFTLIEDYSFGKGDYYLDRAIGYSHNRRRERLINSLYRIWKLLTPKEAPSAQSNLLFLARKDEVPPIGLNPHSRSIAYGHLSHGDKKKVLAKLAPYRKDNFFDEHIGLSKFIDDEQTLING